MEVLTEKPAYLRSWPMMKTITSSRTIGTQVKKQHVRCRVIRYSGIAAAVMVLFFGFGEIGEANRRQVIKVWDDINNMVFRVAVNPVDGENDLQDKTKKDIQAMQKIREQLGTPIISFGYYPEGMEYQKYTILDERTSAMIFYDYKEKSMNFLMQNTKDGAVGYYTIDKSSILRGRVKNDQNITVEIWEVNLEAEEETYAAEFEYNNCKFVLNGMISYDEMKKIAKYMLIL